ncbi:hypothetical protein L1987_75450 [Smallanthus sonchifolius]|uniref:Uncharacterized protein n=1 Tax=Smallanthus sonchifolius TaxID=185202 RepID=A0ACB9A5G6_9ASTR|nr:hypothetical protein L1987_75450 [Smallanthus sonchifolius]
MEPVIKFPNFGMSDIHCDLEIGGLGRYLGQRLPVVISSSDSFSNSKIQFVHDTIATVLLLLNPFCICWNGSFPSK